MGTAFPATSLTERLRTELWSGHRLGCPDFFYQEHAMSITRFHVPIMGFTQDQSRESGMEKLWRRLRRNLPLETQCLVHPQTWDADFDSLAEFFWRNGTSATVVNIYAYSWGCGHGFVKLAKALQARGI